MLLGKEVFKGFIPGHPRTKGSFTAIRNPKTNKIFFKQSDKSRAWQNTIRDLVHRNLPEMLFGDQTYPVSITMTFYIARPMSHYGTGKNFRTLKASAPMLPTSRRLDLDKLIRTVLDGLTSVVYDDDTRVVTIVASKLWAGLDAPGTSGPGVELQIYRWTQAPEVREDGPVDE